MDIEAALQQAIESEREARHRYTEGAENAPDAETRALFQQLARWEEEHERLLTDRLIAVRLLRSGQ